MTNENSVMLLNPKINTVELGTIHKHHFGQDEDGVLFPDDTTVYNVKDCLLDKSVRYIDEKRYKDVLRKLNDSRYMITALVSMLGPNGLETWKYWKDKNIVRIHFDWGPDAAKLTGEERAQIMLDTEKRAMESTEKARSEERERNTNEV